jgi:hypothetical protein
MIYKPTDIFAKQSNTMRKGKMLTLRFKTSVILIALSLLIGGCGAATTTTASTPIVQVPATDIPPTDSPPTATATLAPPPTIAILATSTTIPELILPTSSPPLTSPLTPSPLPSPTPSPTPEPNLNGIPLSDIIVFPPAVIENTRLIYANGRNQGRNPFRFSRIGDSVIARDDFLTRFDGGDYNLGEYTYLQPVIDYFAGSYKRHGIGVQVNLRAVGVFDPALADSNWCEPEEGVLACEIRLNNPSIMILQLGTNDSGSTFGKFMEDVVAFCVERGIVPILITKADLSEDPPGTNNTIIRNLAAEYKVPLIDFEPLAETLPDRGLREDNIHLSFFLPHDYTLPEAFTRGHAMHNLTVLMMLDQIRQEVIQPES